MVEITYSIKLRNWFNIKTTWKYCRFTDFNLPQIITIQKPRDERTVNESNADFNFFYSTCINLRCRNRAMSYVIYSFLLLSIYIINRSSLPYQFCFVASMQSCMRCLYIMSKDMYSTMLASCVLYCTT